MLRPSRCIGLRPAASGFCSPATIRHHKRRLPKRKVPRPGGAAPAGKSDSRPASVADRGAPAAVLAAAAHALAVAVEPAAAADVAALAWAAVAGRAVIIARTGIGAGDAEAQDGADGNACSDAAAATMS